MRVELIKQSYIRKRAEELTKDNCSFDDFINKIKIADWDNPNDIRNTFNSADTIGQNRVIFDLLGNKYRMICVFKFITDIENPWCALYVRWIDTHQEYDKICDTDALYNI